MDDTETPSKKSTEKTLEAWNAWQPETDSERQLKERFGCNEVMELVIGMQKCTKALEKISENKDKTEDNQ